MKRSLHFRSIAELFLRSGLLGGMTPNAIGRALVCLSVLILVVPMGLFGGCTALQSNDTKLHVVRLAAGMNPNRDVEISIADSTADHILVLLSDSPIRWKILAAENTRIREVLFFALNKYGNNSTVTGMPKDLVPIDIRLPMPIMRYSVNEESGKIQASENFNRLQKILLERYGMQITTFQSGVSQTTFMIR